MMVSGYTTIDHGAVSKVDPCGVCGLRVRANSVLCTDPWKVCWSKEGGLQ